MEGAGGEDGAEPSALGRHALDYLPRGATVVFSWGAGEDGQLGLGQHGDEQALQPVTALLDKQVASIVGGSRNSLALTAAGQVYLWGWNQRSTLGHQPDNASKCENVPCVVAALKGERVVQAAVGGWHCLAVTHRGTAFAWGGNEYSQCATKCDKSLGARASSRDIPLPITCVPHLRVRQVAAGGTHSVVLTEQGEVWTWGQPWPPANNKQSWIPVRVQGLRDVATVVSGAFHNVALAGGGRGEVWTWGDNEYGQLGSGTAQPRSAPQPILQLEGKHIVDIAAGGWHSMALTASGELWAWGRGEHGRLGLGDDKSSKMVPVPVTLLASEVIVQVSCGGTHSVALTEDGRMYTFGRADNGRLGPLGHTTTGHPVRVPLPGDQACLSSHSRGAVPEAYQQGPLRVAQISCGGRHSLALACRVEELHLHRGQLPWHRAQAAAASASEAGGGEDRAEVTDVVATIVEVVEEAEASPPPGAAG